MRLTLYDVWQLLCCFIIALTSVNGQTYENVSRLKTSLLANYDTTMIPRHNQADTMDVKINVNIFTIFDVDVVHGILTTLAIVFTTWKDERIAWNSSEHDGLTMLKFPQNSVWTPNIAVAKSMEMDDVGESWMTVQYRPDGMAYWDPSATFQTACAYNVQYWPFDKHICYITFILYGTNSTEALITTDSPGASFLSFIPHSEWEVEGTFAVSSVHTTASTPSVSYGLKLKRHSTFYSLTIIVPLIILNLFNCCVFLLPSDSGERISFSMTIMLSIVVFFLLIGDHVPKTSNPLPLICQFVGIIIGTACASLLFTIFSLSVYFKEGNVPNRSWGRRLVELVQYLSPKSTKVTAEHGDGSANQSTIGTVPFGQIDQQKRSSGKDPASAHLANEKVQDRNGNGIKGRFANKDDVFKQDVKRPLSVLEDENAIATLDWKDVSRAMDKVLFVLFLLATSIPSIVFPINLSVASTYPDA